MSVEPLHLAPEAFDAVVLGVVGLVEDELDALFFYELLCPLAFVNLAVVQEDVPLLASTSQSRCHHLLQLSEELDEGLLGSCLQCLRQEDLPKDSIYCTYAGNTSVIPELVLQGNLLALELEDSGVMRLRRERTLVDEDEDVTMLEYSLYSPPDLHHVLQVLLGLFCERSVHPHKLSLGDAQRLVHPTQVLLRHTESQLSAHLLSSHLERQSCFLDHLLFIK